MKSYDGKFHGVVVEHNPKGQNIYDIPGFRERNGDGPPPPAIVNYDRVICEADHSGKWYAVPLSQLEQD